MKQIRKKKCCEDVDEETTITGILYFKQFWSLASSYCALDSKAEGRRLLYYVETSHLHLEPCDAQSSWKNLHTISLGLLRPPNHLQSPLHLYLQHDFQYCQYNYVKFVWFQTLVKHHLLVWCSVYFEVVVGTEIEFSPSLAQGIVFQHTRIRDQELRVA